MQDDAGISASLKSGEHDNSPSPAPSADAPFPSPGPSSSVELLSSSKLESRTDTGFLCPPVRLPVDRLSSLPKAPESLRGWRTPLPDGGALEGKVGALWMTWPPGTETTCWPCRPLCSRRAQRREMRAGDRPIHPLH